MVGLIPVYDWEIVPETDFIWQKATSFDAAIFIIIISSWF